MRYEQGRLREKIDHKVRQLRPKPFQEKYIYDPFGVYRSYQTAFDVSAVGRQGMLLGSAHPLLAKAASAKMMKALVSDEAYRKINDDIWSRDNAVDYKAVDLYLAPTEGGVELTKRNAINNNNPNPKIKTIALVVASVF